MLYFFEAPVDLYSVHFEWLRFFVAGANASLAQATAQLAGLQLIAAPKKVAPVDIGITLFSRSRFINGADDMHEVNIESTWVY